MLEHKGIEHEWVRLAPGLHPIQLRLAGFRGGTIPALKLDGLRVVGSRRISRLIDEIKPEPSLFPADPARRAAVEAAEEWGDTVLQPIPRRLLRWAFRHARARVRELQAGARRTIHGAHGGLPRASRRRALD
jgi:glutathione S-transferase